MRHIAHIRTEDGEEQPLESHLLEVGYLAEKFSKKIGLGEAGKVVGLLHDLGKFSQSFQNYICSAEGLIDSDHENYVDAKLAKGKIDHSSAGAQYIWRSLCKFGKVGQGELCGQILSLCIASHHSGLIDCLDHVGKPVFWKRMVKSDDRTHLQESLDSMPKDFKKLVDSLGNQQLVKVLFDFVQGLVTIEHSGSNVTISKADTFKLSILVRFLFSCLIDADRINSAEFETPEKKKMRLKQAKQMDWQVAIDRLEKKISGFKLSKDKGPIDHIREDVSRRCLNRSKDPNGIYTLSVPTGGGKTFASLRYGLHHAKHHGSDRIIFVIPYTSIIEQNAEEVRKVLEESGDPFPWVLEHHSNLEPRLQTWHSKLTTENWDSPIVFTTMVQFLEVILGGGTRSVRRMHQLANSVLIFDEIQKLPIKCMYMFCNYLNFFSEQCKSTSILCTATQPILDSLPNQEYGHLRLTVNHELIPCKDQLFVDLERVEIKNRTKPSGWSEAEITELISERLETFGNCLVIVNTKAKALALYRESVERLNGSSVFHLSTSLCPAHRKEVLRKIRQQLDNKEPVICISTQLIEAGVDISFGSVIRFLAGLDSIAQAAGRCNRHGKLCDSKGHVHKGSVDIVNPVDEATGRLAEIEKGKEITMRVLRELPEGQSLLTPDSIKLYFQYYFFDAERTKEMTYPLKGGETLYDLLSKNPLNIGGNRTDIFRPGRVPLLKQSFMEAGKLFRAIDSPSEAVIVSHGRGKELIADLSRITKKFDARNYFLCLKEAQQYSVNLYPDFWDTLLKKQAILEIQPGEGVYYLDEQYYSEEFGVAPDKVSPMTHYEF